jgi:hypothetical protein
MMITGDNTMKRYKTRKVRVSNKAKIKKMAKSVYIMFKNNDNLKKRPKYLGESRAFNFKKEGSCHVSTPQLVQYLYFICSMIPQLKHRFSCTVLILFASMLLASRIWGGLSIIGSQGISLFNA